MILWWCWYRPLYTRYCLIHIFYFFSWFSWIFEIFHYFLNSPFSSFQMETGKQTPRGEGSPGKGTYGKIPLGGLLSLGSPPLAPKLGLNVSVLVGYSLPNKIAYPTPTKRIHISLLAQQDCRGAANHSRVAEGTRLSPEGVYSGVS